MDIIEKLKIDIKKGVSGTGALLGELSTGQRDESIAVLEPGDLVIRDANGNVIFELTAPIAYDVWYLQNTINLLEVEDESLDSITEEYLNDSLSFFEDDLGGIKPVSFIRNLRDLAYGAIWSGRSIVASWNNYTEFFIHLMPFESWLSGLSEQYSSPGPAVSKGFDRNNVVSYIAFP